MPCAVRSTEPAAVRVERLVLVGSSPARIPATEELEAAVRSFEAVAPEEFVREFQISTIHRPVAAIFFEQVVTESLKVPARVWQATAAGWFKQERWAEPGRLL